MWRISGLSDCQLHINLYASHSLHFLLHAAVGWLLWFLRHSILPLSWFIIYQIYCSCHGVSLSWHVITPGMYLVPSYCISRLAESCTLFSVTPYGCMLPSLLNVVNLIDLNLQPPMPRTPPSAPAPAPRPCSRQTHVTSKHWESLCRASLPHNCGC